MTERIQNSDDLIAIVKENPQLWQVPRPFCKMKNAKSKTWKHVGQELGYTEIAVKKKWKNLKDAYRKELKKQLTSEGYQSCWKHFEDMEFMREKLVSQNWTNETKTDQQSESETHSEEEEDEPLMKKKMTSKKKENKIEEPSSSNERKLNTVIRKLNTIKETIETRLPQDEVPKNDPEYQFLMSLLPSVQKLSEIQKIQFRSRVYDCLLEALTANAYDNPLDTKVYIPQISEQGDC